jgi:hypothetical protein
MLQALETFMKFERDKIERKGAGFSLNPARCNSIAQFHGDFMEA